MFWKTKYMSSVLRQFLWVIASLTFPILADKSQKEENICSNSDGNICQNSYGNIQCIFISVYLVGDCSFWSRLGGHWGPDFLWDTWSSLPIQTKETNTFCHLDKYVSNLEKHIWQIGQKHFAISTNTFCNEHLVADTCATSCWWSASASSSLPSPSLPSWSTPSSVGQLPPSGFSSQCFHLICTSIKSKVDNIKIKTLFLICCISPGMFIVQFQKCLHQ